MGPVAVNILDQLDVGVVEFVAGNLVRVTVVIAAHLDHDKVGGLFGCIVEFLGLVAIECVCTATGVRRAVPVPGLFNEFSVFSQEYHGECRTYHAVGAAAVAFKIHQACTGIGLFGKIRIGLNAQRRNIAVP